MSLPMFLLLLLKSKVLRCWLVWYSTSLQSLMILTKINIAVLYYITVAAVSCKQHGTIQYTDFTIVKGQTPLPMTKSLQCNGLEWIIALIKHTLYLRA